MATYYISADRGSDSNNGTSPGTPYLTIGKAIGASGVAAAGDTVYVEPGLYRETITLSVSGSSGSPITIVGDGDGAGFAAGGYSTPKTGVVEVAAWTSDSAAVAAAVLTAVGKSYITIRGFKVVGGGGGSLSSYSCLDLSGSPSNWAIEDCIFFGSASRAVACRVEAAAAVSLGVAFRRCDFASVATNATYYSVDVRSPLSSSEYSLGVSFEDCHFFGSSGSIRVVQVGGSGSAWSTGVTIQQCGFWFCYRGVYVASPTALTTPLGVYGCAFVCCAYGVAAPTAGQVAADGNEYGTTGTPAGAGVTDGGHSITTSRPAWSLHDERLYGGRLRPCFEPTATSPLRGAGGYGTPPSVDLWDRARPDGGSTSPAVGAVERHDAGVKDTTYQDAGSDACLKLEGPSTQDVPLLVDGSEAVTVSIKVRWDGNHGDANKPQAMLLANAEIGVAAQTVTATSTGGSGATPNAYETLTLSAITPSADGVVILRLVSRAAASNGAAYFDSPGFA